jgi:hypothetical protein
MVCVKIDMKLIGYLTFVPKTLAYLVTEGICRIYSEIDRQNYIRSWERRKLKAREILRLAREMGTYLKKAMQFLIWTI